MRLECNCPPPPPPPPVAHRSRTGHAALSTYTLPTPCWLWLLTQAKRCKRKPSSTFPVKLIPAKKCTDGWGLLGRSCALFLGKAYGQMKASPAFWDSRSASVMILIESTESPNGYNLQWFNTVLRSQTLTSGNFEHLLHQCSLMLKSLNSQWLAQAQSYFFLGNQRQFQLLHMQQCSLCLELLLHMRDP